MAFGFSGAAAGASDALTEILARKFAEQQAMQQMQLEQQRIAQQGAQFDARMGQDRDQLAFSKQQHSDDQAYRTGQVERADAVRRDDTNKQGVVRKMVEGIQQRTATPRQAQLTALGEGVQIPETVLDPEAPQRRLIELESIRHQNDMREIGARASQPKDERLVQVMDASGKPIWVRESDAVGKPATQAARAVTGQERKVLGFFQRMLEAERNARAVEEKVGGRDFAAEYAPGEMLENFFRSPEGQQYAQAQRTFTEGRLRKESGAAIANTEYDKDRQTNFKRGGDAPDVLKQKRLSRLTTLRGAGNEAGKALQEFYGPDATIDSLLAEFAEQGGNGTVKMQAPDGSTRDVPADQVEHFMKLGAKVLVGG